jgi:hypothetical protein
MKKIIAVAAVGLSVLSSIHATVINEKFSSNPSLDGWQTFGDTNLFQWDSTNKNLAATWDSTQPNSYFYHPLGTTLSSTNDFMVSFDFQINDLAGGTQPDYPSTFQLAIGLLNIAEATNDGFIIGTGFQAPDILEFDYFPGFDIYSSSVTTPIISSENSFANVGFTFPFALAPGAQYHAVMTYTAANQTLHTTLSSNNVPVGPIQDTTLYDGFGDFSVDTISINSYSQAGQDTNTYYSYFTNTVDGVDVITTNGVIFAGSILAHGTVGKMFFASPLPVRQILHAAPGSIQFSGTTNWIYALERTTNFQSWTTVSVPTPGVDGAMTLSDTNPPLDKAFYRVRADQP